MIVGAAEKLEMTVSVAVKVSYFVRLARMDVCVLIRFTASRCLSNPNLCVSLILKLDLRIPSTRDTDVPLPGCLRSQLLSRCAKEEAVCV